MRLRAEYRVGKEMQFLSNLDMMRMMERALRRAAIPYALTEGFNPHIRLSMGTVLPVGLWGDKEYFDLELKEYMQPEQFVDDLNQVLPGGMTIRQCIEIPPDSPSLMAIINSASYSFQLRAGLGLTGLRDDLLKKQTLIVLSRGKQKGRKKDLRPGIFQIKVENGENSDILELWVSTGQPLNIRFDELYDLLKMWGLTEDDFVDIWRSGNYIRKSSDFFSPMKIGDVSGKRNFM
ncbi:MAG: TIGR03936 family radical SAM-associated protein [Syntrophomonadaceae bacterium]|jgi:radical SAM-linked protein